MENPIRIIADIARRWKQARDCARMEALRKDGQQAVNVMEFDGQLYLSCNGIPLVNTEYLPDIHPVLKDARSTREKYYAKFIIEK